MTENSPWYRWDDMPPPYTVQTRWQLEGRIFVAIRGKHPKSNRDLYAEVLPDGQRRVLRLNGALPDLWQPLHPHLWRMPLPEPVVLSRSGIMATTIQRYKSVDDALRSSDAKPEFHMKRDVKPLWHDPDMVRYEPRGQVSMPMAEARAMRALAWCGAGSGWQARAKLTGDVLSVAIDLMKLASAEADTSDMDAIATRFYPQRSDRQDFDVAMGWVTALNPPELWHKRRKAWSLSRMQKVLLWRSLPVPLSFEAIGHEFDWKGHQRAQQVYADGIEKIWRAANGMRVHRQLNPVDQIAALRERKRAARRQQEVA